MKYITKQNGNLELTFSSPINIDNGYTNRPLGDHESTMELFFDSEGVPNCIEWYIESLDICEHIGLYFKGKKLTDYDGIFALPPQSVSLIRKSGYIVPHEFTK